MRPLAISWRPADRSDHAKLRIALQERPASHSRRRQQSGARVQGRRRVPLLRGARRGRPPRRRGRPRLHRLPRLVGSPDPRTCRARGRGGAGGDGATGRDLIVKFDGCYHGHADSLLVKAGSGGATFGIPDSAGVPAALAALTLALPFNDLAAESRALESRRGEVAAVLVEPVAGNMGVVPPAPGFLAGLRELCTRHGALLIFDEVITGFRVAFGGAQALYSVRPDLTCLGKIIGGGLPVGAYGGSRELMSR